MAPKKNAKTALYFFAQERRAEKGYTSIREALEAVYPEWKAMSMTEREPYEALLKEYKEAQKKEKEFSYSNSKPVITNDPNDFHDRPKAIRDELDEKFKQLTIEARKIKSSVEKSDIIKNQRWYFIKFQSFCKSEINPYKDVNKKFDPYFVLAEVGIVEYSLLEGITNEYHAFIKPGLIPVGYRSACMDSSKDVHQIPIDNFDQIKETYAEIYANLIKFLRPKPENNYYVPLFCMAKDIEETKFGFDFLKIESKSESVLNEKVFDLECLVLFLTSCVSSLNLSYNAARDLLTSYSFDYSPNSRCEFHEEAGSTFCALGFAKRAAFHISDRICKSYGIEVTPKHIPVEEPVGTIIYNDTYSARVPLRNSYSRSSNSYKKRTYESSQEDIRMDNNRPSSSMSSVISTDIRMEASYNETRFRSHQMPQMHKPMSNRRLVADKFESNLLAEQQSSGNQRNSRGREYEARSSEMNFINDEGDDWSVVNKNKPIDKNNNDNQSVVSEKSGSGVASSLVTSSFSEVTSKTTSSVPRFMGRGRLMNSQKN